MRIRSLIAIVLFVSAGLMATICGMGAPARAHAAESEASVTGRVGSSAWTVTDFSRLNGTVRIDSAGDAMTLGYPVASSANFSVLVFRDRLILHTPADFDQPGYENEKESFIVALLERLTQLDRANADGGEVLDLTVLPATIALGKTLETPGVTYRFDVPSQSKNINYAAIEYPHPEQSEKDEPLYALTGKLVALDKAPVPAAGSSMSNTMKTFFDDLDMRPLWVSLKTAGVALVIAIALGLFAGFLSFKLKSFSTSVLDTILTIPLILPPTVCGFLLLLLLGNSSAVGRWMTAHDISIVFSWPAAVLASAIVSFPLFYRTARGAFEGIDRDVISAAQVLGWSDVRIFLHIIVPLTWPSLAAGAVLAFARAVGEFGATLFVAGNYAGETQTIPLAIYYEWMGGNISASIFWVAVVIALSFIVVFAINRLGHRARRYEMEA